VFDGLGIILVHHWAYITMVCTLQTSALQNVSKELNETDELDYLSSATLTKRKDFLDREEEARGANRVLYFRRNADNDLLISACSRKLEEDPCNVRALLLRAASYVKKGELFSPSRLPNPNHCFLTHLPGNLCFTGYEMQNSASSGRFERVACLYLVIWLTCFADLQCLKQCVVHDENLN
jgi:hypothetical protein